jgi:hypothetical protein
MKYIGLIFAALLVFLVACAPAQTMPAAQPAPAAPAAQPVAQPGPTPVVTAPVPTVSKELQDLLSRADQRVKSYKYLELILPDKKQPDTISVKGSKVKVKLYEYEPYIPKEYFDTIYLDTATQTAIGRCETKARCVWAQGDNTKRAWTNLDYNQFRRKTPYEFVKEVPSTATIMGPEVHFNRGTTRIQYDDAGKLVDMWIDDSYGLPVEISITTSDGKVTSYKFNDMTFNGLADRDVTAPALA